MSLKYASSFIDPSSFIFTRAAPPREAAGFISALTHVVLSCLVLVCSVSGKGREKDGDAEGALTAWDVDVVVKDVMWRALQSSSISDCESSFTFVFSRAAGCHSLGSSLLCFPFPSLPIVARLALEPTNKGERRRWRRGS